MGGLSSVSSACTRASFAPSFYRLRGGADIQTEDAAPALEELSTRLAQDERCRAPDLGLLAARSAFDRDVGHFVRAVEQIPGLEVQLQWFEHDVRRASHQVPADDDLFRIEDHAEIGQHDGQAPGGFDDRDAELLIAL